MMMMSRTCYYDNNDELFIIMMMHAAKLLYEHDALLYILVCEMNMLPPLESNPRSFHPLIYIITHHAHITT